MSNDYNEYSDSKVWDYLTIIGFVVLNILAFIGVLNTFLTIILMFFDVLMVYYVSGRLIVDKL